MVYIKPLVHQNNWLHVKNLFASHILHGALFVSTQLYLIICVYNAILLDVVHSLYFGSKMPLSRTLIKRFLCVTFNVLFFFYYAVISHETALNGVNEYDTAI